MPTTNPNSSPVPEFLVDEKEHRRQIARRVNLQNQGKLNVTLDVTLNANAATTVIKDPRLDDFRAIIPAMALSASAATAIAAGIWFDSFVPEKKGSAPAPAQITAHHNNTADTDKKIRFLFIG